MFGTRVTRSAGAEHVRHRRVLGNLDRSSSHLLNAAHWKNFCSRLARRTCLRGWRADSDAGWRIAGTIKAIRLSIGRGFVRA